MKKKQSVILVIMLSISFCYFFMSSSGLNCSNDSSHFALAMAMKNDSTLSIEKYAEVLSLKPDFAIKNGVMYSDRLPGNAVLIAATLYCADLFKGFFLSSFENEIEYYISVATLLPNLCGTVGLFLLFLILFKCFKLSFSSSIALMLIGGLCTLNVLESIHLFSHAPSMLAITFIYYYILKKGEEFKSIDLYIIMTVIGAATCIELQNILFVIPLFVYWLSQPKKSESYGSVFNWQNFTIGGGVLILFLGLLLWYNYSAFGVWTLKSNKFNPFFPEEASFLTSLSGNPLVGLDQLFTSFGNMTSNWNWSLGTSNETPGYLSANPIYWVSSLGLFFMYKEKRKEALLLISFVLISVLVAIFHKTTLVRHIFTVHFLMYLSIAFVVKRMEGYSKSKQLLCWTAIFILALHSFFKTMYITNHYWWRDFGWFEFSMLA